MFDRSQIIIDNIEDDIKILLSSLNDRTNWNQRCKDELENLKTALLKRKYKTFLGHPNRYHLSAIGESCLYDVPLDRRGELKDFRGMRVRIVCVSSGRYTRLLMAGVVSETPKDLQVKRKTPEYFFPEHVAADVMYKSPRYLAIRQAGSSANHMRNRRGETINLDGVDFVLFDGLLRQPIALFRHGEGGTIRGGLIGSREDDHSYETLHSAVRSLIKESARRSWLFS